MDGKSLEIIWRDQAEFDKMIRRKPATWDEQCTATRDLALGIISEVHDLLAGLHWKPNRREVSPENHPRIHHEIGDLFKFMVSLCQVWNVSPALLNELYWQVSLVCASRRREESTEPLRNIALVDIDGVLCDYRSGLLGWLQNYGRLTPSELAAGMASKWLNAASFAITEERWQKLKHAFRTSGAKRALPAYSYTRELVFSLHSIGYQVVLLTSRPVHEYPNIRDDTLLWLEAMRIPYDRLWFARDKFEHIARKGVEKEVRVAIDDDPIFCRQLHALPSAQVYHVAFNGFRWDIDVHGAVPRNVLSVNGIEDMYNDLRRLASPPSLPLHGRSPVDPDFSRSISSGGYPVGLGAATLGEDQTGDVRPAAK